MSNIRLSICTFQNNDFDIMFEDIETGKQLTFSGNQKLSDEDHELSLKIAPACVFTEYAEVRHV